MLKLTPSLSPPSSLLFQDLASGYRLYLKPPDETVILKTQMMFEGSKGSLAKMFWKILFLALMIGEYEKAAW